MFVYLQKIIENFMKMEPKYANILKTLEKCDNLKEIMDSIVSFHTFKPKCSSELTQDLVHKQFLKDIRSLSQYKITFGNSLRNITLIITDLRERNHKCFISYLGLNKLKITSTSLPYASFQDVVYKQLQHAVEVFENYVHSLQNYFLELERIDRFCTVMEPVNPTFKDDFRKILLADRVWLHIEVTLGGSATNIHLIGAGDVWYHKLQTHLPHWDHDKDIVENIMCIFDIDEFPHFSVGVPEISAQTESENNCGICLCHEVDGVPGVPQPLCQNAKCGMYFHKNCLSQWLLASCMGRLPNFGIVSGQCPHCLKYISCSLAGDK